jgi:hypothetical protein
VQLSLLKGSGDGVLHLKESCFWTLSIVCFLKITALRKLDFFPSSGKIMMAPILLGPFERASLNHWMTGSVIEAVQKTLIFQIV